MKGLNFEQVAKDAGLSDVDAGHFVEGMTKGADELPLGREAYTLLQTLLEREVLGVIPLNAELPASHDARPFAYATPKPLTSLYTPGHPRNRIAGIMFRRLLGVSVMEEAELRSTVQENMRAGREISVTAGRAFCNGADIFSTTLNPADVQPPRMTMHFEREGEVARVAFAAEQQPSETAGRLIFGDRATEMYREVLATHQANVEGGRGAEHVYKLITGQDLRRD